MTDKKRILVIPPIQHTEKFAEQFKDYSVTKARYRTLEFKFIDNKASVISDGTELTEFSFVWLISYWTSRDIAYATKLFLDFNGIKHTNVETSTSKITDQMLFTLNGIETPNTYFCDSKQGEWVVKSIEAMCEYPVIIKDTKGLKGINSIFINNREELISAIKGTSLTRKFFFQSYIRNEYDWGIMVANGKVVVGEKRFPSATEFRNNVYNGGTEFFIPVDQIPENVKEMAIKATKALNLDWARADILIEKGTEKPYLLEVNRCPGITTDSDEVQGALDFLKSQVQ